MILTIGMIVKNEAKRLRGCLTRLRPILEQVDSELIIADTGSADDTVGIAREFTPNVMRIPWNNNFAEARNYTIRAAKGEWYLVIDADEYFEDTRDLIAFFNSGLYKNFASAAIVLRNYTAGGVAYTANHLTRLYKLGPGIFYTGHVHETLPYSPPVCALASYARHLGYIDASNPRLMREKARRNFPMIKRSYEENPNSENFIRYMADYYMCEEDYAQAMKYIKKGLTLVGGDNTGVIYHAFYDLLARCHMSDKKDPRGSRKAIAAVDEYLARRSRPSYTSIGMYYYKGLCHKQLEEYAEAAAAFMESYALTEAYLAGKLDISEAPFGSGGSIAGSEYGKWLNAYNTAECFAKLKKYDDAFFWLGRTPLEHEVVVMSYFLFIAESGQFHRVRELFGRIAELRFHAAKLDVMESCLARFDKIILAQKNAADILAPFLDEYTAVKAALAGRL